MTPPPTSWKPRQAIWTASDSLAGMRRDEVALGADELASLKDYFWFDLCAEWDSRHLHERLAADVRSHPDRFGSEFLAFEQAWYEDEINHAEGFMKLYSILYEESEASIRKRLEKRRPDFSEVEPFLADEFTVCVLFAYDELATMRAYRMDVDLYARFERPETDEFIRLLLRDETYHHKNGFDLAIRNHRHRLGEVEAVIDSFLAFDQEGHRYQGTFIFDHDWAHVDGNFFARTAEILRMSFHRARDSRAMPPS